MDGYVDGYFQARGVYNVMLRHRYNRQFGPVQNALPRRGVFLERNPRFRFDGVQGVGFNGGILIFSESDPTTGLPRRKLSIKYALNAQQEQRIEHEKNFMDGLVTAEHIQQRIPIRDSRVNFGPINSRYMIATEYLHLGSLAQLRERCRLARRPIPNRVVWHIFRCLARQLCALENPPAAKPDFDPRIRVQREDPWINVDGRTKTPIAHNAMEMYNLRIGNNDDNEHGFLPVIKNTNLSRCSIEEFWEDADFLNLRDVGKVISELATTGKPLQLMHEDRIKVPTEIQRAYLQWNRLNPDNARPSTMMWSDADPDFLRMLYVDWELRELVARCTNNDDNDEIVDKSWLLAACDDAIASRTWETTIRENDPTDPDYAVRAAELSAEGEVQFVQDFVYNASVPNSLLGDVYDVMGPAPEDQSLYYQEAERFFYGDV
ncbi:hypothetical protein GGR53DRAFT_483565 [Hypoxylon sp. FL1150]|nr:hypothetical protein GGR53DRAFT_483565 [Hypoxylon sp. FL1150]